MMFGNGFAVGLALGCVLNVLAYLVTGLVGFIDAAAMCLTASAIVAMIVNG